MPLCSSLHAAAHVSTPEPAPADETLRSTRHAHPLRCFTPLGPPPPTPARWSRTRSSQDKLRPLEVAGAARALRFAIPIAGRRISTGA
uniref:Uncharacterized protein n=1 Tax=Setaria viridis TaxID=4556 RepID=A0A4U6VT51_SETVI|nr:hypothetical protein SEVIR_2G171550v2 [Setaria viridis]